MNLTSLYGNNWLTDEVINEYGKLVNMEFLDTFVFSTHFLTSLKNRGFEKMTGWTKGFDPLKKKFIFFPIHENSHWYLLILNKITKSFEILDPYEPMGIVNPPRKYKKQTEETKMKKITEVELRQKEKVNYILENYI